LIEIAATPDRVRVPSSLRNTLQLAFERQHGAFALLSGRPLAELDDLFAPCKFPISGKHGLEIRVPSGMGGHSIRVGNLAQTAARFRFSSVSTVVAWLRNRNLCR
jgi:trehalose-6-phosphatase